MSGAPRPSPPAPPGLPTWLGLLPLLDATARVETALATGLAALALLALARPALALLSPAPGRGTRWATQLLLLATLASVSALAMQAAWPDPAPGTLAVGLLGCAVLLAGPLEPSEASPPGDAPPPGMAGAPRAARAVEATRQLRRGLALGLGVLTGLAAIALVRAGIGPLGAHPASALAGAALLGGLQAALPALRRTSTGRRPSPRPGPPS